MAEPLQQPTAFVWETQARWHALDEMADTHGLIAKVEGPEDSFAYATVFVGTYSFGFRVSLGSFETTGDANNIDDAKRCAELAFGALIELNNRLNAESANV
jgi:hypothetical protein